MMMMMMTDKMDLLLLPGDRFDPGLLIQKERTHQQKTHRETERGILEDQEEDTHQEEDQDFVEESSLERKVSHQG